MEQRGQFGAAARLAGLSRRFRFWRERFGGRGRRLPEGLWKAAADLAREQGVGRIARLLRLRAEALERRLASQGDVVDEAGDDPRFIEIGAVGSSDADACVVEFEAIQGARLTIRVKDAGRLDLAGLVDSFWSHCR